MASLGTLALDLIARTAPFTKAIRKAKVETDSFSKSAQRAASKGVGALRGSMGRLSSMAGSLTGQLGILGGAAGLGGLAAFAVKAAADMESTRVAFKTMLKDAKLADKVVADLFQFSKVTPFEPGEVFQAGRGLLAAGFAARDLRKELQMIGDIAAGSQSNLNELIAAYQQVGTTGRLELSDVNKFANRGIPIYEALAKVMGVTKSEIRELSQKGKIGLSELQDAFKVLTEEGGIYHNAMIEQSETLNGLLSTTKGLLTAAAGAFGEGIAKTGELRGMLEGINKALEQTDWKAWAAGFGDNLPFVAELRMLREEMALARKNAGTPGRNAEPSIADGWGVTGMPYTTRGIRHMSLSLQANINDGLAAATDAVNAVWKSAPGHAVASRLGIARPEGLISGERFRVEADTARNMRKKSAEDHTFSVRGRGSVPKEVYERVMREDAAARMAEANPVAFRGSVMHAPGAFPSPAGMLGINTGGTDAIAAIGDGLGEAIKPAVDSIRAVPEAVRSGLEVVRSPDVVQAVASMHADVVRTLKSIQLPKVKVAR